jgi:hypothetical protein
MVGWEQSYKECMQNNPGLCLSPACCMGHILLPTLLFHFPDRVVCVDALHRAACCCQAAVAALLFSVFRSELTVLYVLMHCTVKPAAAAAL